MSVGVVEGLEDDVVRELGVEVGVDDDVALKGVRVDK